LANFSRINEKRGQILKICFLYVLFQARGVVHTCAQFEDKIGLKK
jgi:hypothetical protein